MVHLFYEKNQNVLLERASQKLFSLLEEARGLPILFLTSGGSSLDLLKNIPAPDSLRITCGVLDERMREGFPASNFLQFSKTHFFKSLPKNQDATLLPREAEQFETSLKKWKNENKNGVVIVTQGIGADGHTAGVFPFPEKPELFAHMFLDESRWAVEYNAKERSGYPLRMTTTLSFLRDVVDHSLVYAIGDEKKNALLKIFSREGMLAETPGRIVHEMRDVSFFTDIETHNKNV